MPVMVKKRTRMAVKDESTTFTQPHLGMSDFQLIRFSFPMNADAIRKIVVECF
jgi:hypothetical protein